MSMWLMTNDVTFLPNLVGEWKAAVKTASGSSRIDEAAKQF